MIDGALNIIVQTTKGDLMKKKSLIILSLMVLFVAGVVHAEDVVTAPTDTPALPFNLWVLIQQIMTNGGLALLAFLASKLGGKFGVVIRKIVDFLSANTAHK